MKRQALIVIALVFLLRLPFLNEAVQGDDLYYLYGAQHAQVEPLHPLHTHYAFLGQMVDMRGHPHGPLNAWVLGALLAVFGEVREVPFHAAYILFSLLAALAMLSLARRFCPEKALLATLLFITVPAFVVNGNSFEADLVFLALWMTSIAAFMQAIDTRSWVWLGVSAAAGALAGLDAYQAVMLTPILGLYLWQRDRKWLAAWPAVIAAPLTIIAWQTWEWWTSGTFPISVLLGYMQNGSLQSAANKIGSAVALTAHAGWVVFPALVALAFARSAGLWRWIIVGTAALGAAAYDWNPLFWISIAMGVLLITMGLRREFLNAWIVIFFAASVAIFFAGSARYLLPIAAPVAIVVAREVSRPWLLAGFGAQLVVSLGLATVNHQHWGAVRDFADQVIAQANGRRIWVNSEWGLRHYLEAGGARPLLHDSMLGPGDLIVTSDLGRSVSANAPLAPLAEATIAPKIPLRIISIEGGSGYSASSKGLLPFEISNEVIDRLRLETVIERKAELSYLDPKDPRAAAQIIRGLDSDGWMRGEASVLVKVPENGARLEASVFIPADAPARTITLLSDGATVGEETFGGPGAHTLSVPFRTNAAQVTISLRVDATHKVPGDDRDLGVIVLGVGFRE